ncbi:hypothetical protein ACTXHP_08835 [Bacillus stercoris]|uniref:hypothetical protein n=1 Tax=Bacillus stercoris TaxID=2054641 RepID=UPI00404573B9
MQTKKNQKNQELTDKYNDLKIKYHRSLEVQEDLITLCQELIKEKEYIEARYNNLKESKLGRLTVWMWKRRRRNK